MKARLAAIAAVVAVLLGILFAAPAAAQNSTVSVSPVVVESTYPGSAYATAQVTGDVQPTAGGTLTYSLFVNSSTCGGSPFSQQTVALNSDGTVPDSTPVTGLGAGTDSFEAVYTSTDGVNDSSPPGVRARLSTLARPHPARPSFRICPGAAPTAEVSQPA